MRNLRINQIFTALFFSIQEHHKQDLRSIIIAQKSRLLLNYKRKVLGRDKWLHISLFLSPSSFLFFPESMSSYRTVGEMLSESAMEYTRNEYTRFPFSNGSFRGKVILAAGGKNPCGLVILLSHNCKSTLPQVSRSRDVIWWVLKIPLLKLHHETCFAL